MSGLRKVCHLVLFRLRRPQVEIEIIWSTDCKTFTNLNSVYFVLKKLRAKEIETKRKKLSTQRIVKLFTEF